MGLHRGQASARRRRDIPWAGPRQQEATPRDGSAPGTRPPPSGGEASHGQHESWICTGDQASAIRGGEASHGQYPAKQAPTRAMRRETPSTLPHTEDRPVPRKHEANRAMRSETPPRPRHTEARRDTPVVTHPTPTAGRDDLTPLLRNVWSATIRSLPA
jgi:hypothetical protein